MKHCLIWRGTWQVLEGSRGYLRVSEKCCHGQQLWVVQSMQLMHDKLNSKIFGFFDYGGEKQ